MSRLLPVCGAAFCAAVVLFARPDGCRGGEPTRAEQRIEEALSSETALEFVETPLTDVIDYLKERHKIEIQVNKKTLDDVGIGTDTPISKNLKSVSLRSALDLMLTEMDLAYVVENEVLMITTTEDAANRLMTKVYPVADLVGAAGDPAERQAKLQSLALAVTSAVAPESWRSGGVMPGAMAPATDRRLSRRGPRGPGEAPEPVSGEGRGTIVGGSFGTHGAPEVLIVRQTYENHRQVADLLHELRKADTTSKPR